MNRYKVSFALNIIGTVILVLMSIYLCFAAANAFRGSDALFGKSTAAIDALPTDGDDPSAGFMALFDLFAGGFMGLLGVLAYIAAFLLLCAAALVAVFLIVSIVMLVKFKKKGSSKYLLIDCVMKISCAGLIQLVLFLLTVNVFGASMVILFFVNPFSITLILSIVSLCLVNKGRRLEKLENLERTAPEPVIYADP